MPDKSPRDAAFASDRLREVLDSMRDIWSKSLEEVSPDGSIDLYVVDADVVRMFMAPLRMHNYGALLRYDWHAREDEGSDLMEFESQVVEFLGYLIFFQLRPTTPLLLLPGHANELERMLNTLWHKANKEHGNWERTEAAIRESACKVLETSKAQLASAAQTVAVKGEKTRDVEALLKKIFDSLRGQGAVGELYRLGDLVSGERLCHLDKIALQDENCQVRYLPPPLTEAGNYIPAVSRLADRLKRAMLSRRKCADDPLKMACIQRDAEALAHLAWLNELFRVEQWYVDMGDGSTRRIRQMVLITGSHLLPQAIDELELIPLRGCVASPLSFLGHRVMDQYFRRSTIHQHVQMEETTIQGSQASALINFFDSMRAVLDAAIQTKKPSDISDAIVKVRGQHYKLTESWQGRQLLGEHSQMKAVYTAIESLIESGNPLDGLKDFLENLSVDTWQKFARSVTMLSLRSVSLDQAVLRNIPPVRFMRFEKAKEISGKLYRIGDSAKAREIANSILDKPTIRRLKREDPSHYTEFVCYALFGLVHRILRSAEGCAEVAWSIAQSGPTEGKFSKYITGDESLYLLAHIIRLRASRVEHMRRAEDCINLALEASSQASKVDNFDHVDDIRYSAERFSIHSHKMYFECFGPVGRWDSLSRIDRNVDRLRLTLFEGKELLDKLNKAEPESDDRYLFEYVNQQLLVNLAQIGLLIFYPAERKSDEKVEALHPCESEERAKISKDDTKILKDITEQLVLQCEMLYKDQTGTMARPSILSTSVAAVSSSVFLNKHDLENWFWRSNGKVAAVDGLRYMYLESVFDKSRKFPPITPTGR